jgi:ABC-2 type transport system ATP-binding protein
MKIILEQAGKRFNYDWIFRRVTATFNPGERYAILGPNGSGKSTLLQVISGHIHHNEGSVTYSTPEKLLPPDQFFRHCAIAAPYLELVEEFTLAEAVQFHLQFKQFIPAVKAQEAITIVGLEKSLHKQIRYFSSGMKQRLKLALAIFSDVPILLLDEPCTNLDAAGIQLYQDMITTYAGDRMIIVSSNDEQEYFMCNNTLSILDYK